MKNKVIDYITQITLIMLVLILACVISKLIQVNDELNNQKLVIKELQERTLNHEYRLENIMPNDDLP